jgi:hypothetical protein
LYLIELSGPLDRIREFVFLLVTDLVTNPVSPNAALATTAGDAETSRSTASRLCWGARWANRIII